MARKVCTVEGCGSFVQGRGFCPNHYQRWRRNGHPTVPGRALVQVSPNGDRSCLKCGAAKPPEEFGRQPNSPDGLDSRCKPCKSSDTKARYHSDTEKYRAMKVSSELRRRAAKALVGVDTTITKEGLRERLGDACAYCNRGMDFTPRTRATRSPDSASVDHILPLSRGGAHAWDNVVLCCLECNLKKGSNLVEDFIKGTTQERIPSPKGIAR